MALLDSGLDRDLVQQQLDDCCACGQIKEGKLERFATYRGVCERTGFSLADGADKYWAYIMRPQGGHGVSR